MRIPEERQSEWCVRVDPAARWRDATTDHRRTEPDMTDAERLTAAANRIRAWLDIERTPRQIACASRILGAVYDLERVEIPSLGAAATRDELIEVSSALASSAAPSSSRWTAGVHFNAAKLRLLTVAEDVGLVRHVSGRRVCSNGWHRLASDCNAYKHRHADTSSRRWPRSSIASTKRSWRSRRDSAVCASVGEDTRRRSGMRSLRFPRSHAAAVAEALHDRELTKAEQLAHAIAPGGVLEVDGVGWSVWIREQLGDVVAIARAPGFDRGGLRVEATVPRHGRALDRTDLAAELAAELREAIEVAHEALVATAARVHAARGGR